MTPTTHTCLDPLETIVSTSDTTPSAIHADDLRDPKSFRHSGWQPTRHRIWRALHSAGASVSRLSAFSSCGDDAWLVRSAEDPQVVAIQSDHCHDRFCTPCNVSRAHRLASRVAELCANRNVRFVTLTLKHNPDPLSNRLAFLLRSFRTLRHHRIWTRHVRGGVAFIEVKRNLDTGCWHPHIHALVEGSYFPKQDLATDWYSITGDSYVVHIARPKRLTDVSRYVAKYITKPLDAHTLHDHDSLTEAIAALHRKRLCTTFGTWRGYPLNDLPDPVTWDKLFPLARLLDAARNGDQDSLALLAALRRTNRCRLDSLRLPLLARDGPTGDCRSSSPALHTAPCAETSLDPTWLLPLPVY